ncbi:MAG: electron transfer flavoprotein subunit alpha/FixB family protein [Thermoplasmata archaeon]
MSERVLVLGPDFGGNDGINGIGRELAGPEGLVAALTGESTTSARPDLEADRVYQVSAQGFDGARGDHLAAAIVEASRAFGATMVLSGPKKVEREALARAGALLHAPTVTGVHSPRVAAGGLEVSRDLLSGNATSVERITSRPVLLALSAIPAGSKPGTAPRRAAEMVPLAVDLPHYHFQRNSFQSKLAGGLNLEAADRIVSIGRGLQKKEDLALIEGLAAVLGAAVGCTRPIAAEAGWLSDEHWVGLTGHRVRPSLYVAIGISGAAQHLVGMRDSKIVVAINNDANAPIFQQADYQVVGDLYAIVPELTRRLVASPTASS